MCVCVFVLIYVGSIPTTSPTNSYNENIFHDTAVGEILFYSCKHGRKREREKDEALSRVVRFGKIVLSKEWP